MSHFVAIATGILSMNRQFTAEILRLSFHQWGNSLTALAAKLTNKLLKGRAP